MSVGNEDRDLELVKKHASELMEHFDSVQIADIYSDNIMERERQE